MKRNLRDYFPEVDDDRIDELADEVEYEEDNDIEMDSFKSSTPYFNKKEIKMSNMEKEELKDRFGGMREEEREIFLHGLSTADLYKELGRRLDKAERFADSLRTTLTAFTEED